MMFLHLQTMYTNAAFKEHLEAAVRLQRNQVIHIGNPRVSAAGGCEDMAMALQTEMEHRQLNMAIVMICGKGKFFRLDTSSQWIKLDTANPDEALQMARDAAGTTTIFVCGTAEMTSRSLSVVTELHNSNSEVAFLCPPTLVTNVSPIGRSCEEFFQGLSRGTGDFKSSLAELGQVDADGVPYVSY